MSITGIALTGTPGVTAPGGAATSPSGTTSSGATGGSSFSEALTRLVDAVDDNAAQANEAVAGMLNKTGDVHDAMIALQRAEMSLQLTVQIRNKIVQAYQDIMRMPV